MKIALHLLTCSILVSATCRAFAESPPPYRKACEGEDGRCWCAQQQCARVQLAAEVGPALRFHTKDFEIALPLGEISARLETKPVEDDEAVSFEDALLFAVLAEWKTRSGDIEIGDVDLSTLIRHGPEGALFSLLSKGKAVITDRKNGAKFETILLGDSTAGVLGTDAQGSATRRHGEYRYRTLWTEDGRELARRFGP